VRKFLLLLLFVSALFQSNAQSSSFERGFAKGYCQAKKEDKGQYTNCSTTPIAPLPKIGKESYSDGVIVGYQYYQGKGSAQNALIQGARDVGRSKFINYSYEPKRTQKKVKVYNPNKGWNYNNKIELSNGYYIGTTNNGKREKEGTYYWNSGHIFEGNWNHNKREGKGILYYPKSSDKYYYEGNWRNDKKFGSGYLYFKDGTKQRLYYDSSGNEFDYYEKWGE
jgi:hypothetical protein